MKKFWVFIYLSFLLHVYLFVFLDGVMDRDVIKLLKQAQQQKPTEVEIETFLIDNPHATQQPPQKKAKLSDRDSRSQGPVASQEEYNAPGAEEKPSSLPQRDEKGKENVASFSPPMQAAPLLYNPEKRPVVQMTSSGQIALESEAVDYAPYFKQIQQTVSSNWQIYFPIFQYYRGIMANGIVTVTFQLDNDGNLIDAQVTKEFGYDSLNQASLQAIKHTTNYGPLPEKLRSPDGITVEFHFIYTRP